jgi:hypothetical protein
MQPCTKKIAVCQRRYCGGKYDVLGSRDMCFRPAAIQPGEGREMGIEVASVHGMLLDRGWSVVCAVPAGSSRNGRSSA